MASPGLLFLLLMSSSLFLSTLSVSTSSDLIKPDNDTPQKINKLKEVAKVTGKFILNSLDQIRYAVTPFLTLIPVHKEIITAVSILALVGGSVLNKLLTEKPMLDALKSEFENLNFKLDQYHVQQRWDSWAGSAFHKPEKNIEVAWKSYESLVSSILQSSDPRQTEKLRKELLEICSKSQTATKTLYTYLTAKGPTLMNNLGTMLAEHVKCHERDIREYYVFISKLIYKGNTMNQMCYELKQILTKDIIDNEARIAYDSASVMFQIHKNCILNSMDYIKKDVRELIDTTVKRSKLANTVRLELEKMYNRYDWMVVAFLTKKSEHKVVETLNSHVLSGFTKVTKGEVTVAVARQAKGTHTMASKVKTAIDACFAKQHVLCYKVPEKLGQCQNTVDRIPVSKTYTAVHAFIKKAHDSFYAEDQIYPDREDSSSEIPYIYRGDCEKSPGVKGGRFVVLIKSDEELLIRDPCSKLNCGSWRRGTCVRMGETFGAMCECRNTYYGENCEHSLDDYKRGLQADINQVLPKRTPAVVIRYAVPNRSPTVVIRHAVPNRPPTVDNRRRSQFGRRGF